MPPRNDLPSAESTSVQAPTSIHSSRFHYVGFPPCRCRQWTIPDADIASRSPTVDDDRIRDHEVERAPCAVADGDWHAVADDLTAANLASSPGTVNRG